MSLDTHEKVCEALENQDMSVLRIKQNKNRKAKLLTDLKEKVFSLFFVFFFSLSQSN